MHGHFKGHVSELEQRLGQSYLAQRVLAIFGAQSTGFSRPACQLAFNHIGQTFDPTWIVV